MSSPLLGDWCEPLGKGAWPNRYLLEGMVDGERALGEGEGAEEGAGWRKKQPRRLAEDKGSGVAGCRDVSVQGSVVPQQNMALDTAWSSSGLG